MEPTPILDQEEKPVTKFEASISNLRIGIKITADAIKELSYEPNGEYSDEGECMANIKLAYRHLEDAAMRLGKVYQALDGGKSIYKK